MNQYDVILDGTHYLRDLIQDTILLEESLAEIAYRATINTVVTPDYPRLEPGQSVKITDSSGILFDGVLWETESQKRGNLKQITWTCYDRTIYMQESEDEYLWQAGQTASQRIKKYASDWGISLGTLEDTKIALAKNRYSPRPIYSMVLADLTETAKKGGNLYRVRIGGTDLELIQIGSNSNVWVLENIDNLEQIRTLKGTVTQVKVLGKTSEGRTTPVLAIVKGENGKYGTLQKVLQDDKIKNAGQAKTAGEELLCGIRETITVSGVYEGSGTIRAGDKVSLSGWELIAMSVKHELGNPRKFILQLGSVQEVRRRFYFDGI